MLKICAALALLVAFSVTASAQRICYSDAQCETKVKKKSDLSCTTCLGSKGPGKSWVASDGDTCVKKLRDCPQARRAR